MKTFQIVSLNISEKTGEIKKPVEGVILKENHGMTGDAHAGDWHRQVSLLAIEDIETMRKKYPVLKPGNFAENITTKNIDLASLPVGSKLAINETLLEVTQIGKECHNVCEIRQMVGDCVMPRRGIFARVIKGGKISCESIGTYDF